MDYFDDYQERSFYDEKEERRYYAEMEELQHIAEMSYKLNTLNSYLQEITDFLKGADSAFENNFKIFFPYGYLRTADDF